MIAAQTPAGKKGYLLRGAFTPRGKVRIATASVTTPAGDKVFWDIAASSAGFTVDALPSSVSGAGASPSAMEIRTTSPTAAATGGVGTIFYEWAQTAGADLWAIERPLTASPNFVAEAVGAYEIQTATFTVTATDTAGRTATDTVTASARNYGDPSAPAP